MDDHLIRILLAEDNAGDARLLAESLREISAARFEMTHEESLKAALGRLTTQPFDVLLLDLSLPDSQGLDTVSRAHEQAFGVPIIVLTGTDDEATGLEAVRRGAQDYLVKGQTDGRLLARAIRYAMQRKQAEADLTRAKQRLELAQKAGCVGTFEWDARTKGTIWTDGLEAIYGVRAGEFLDTYEAWRRRVHPDDIEETEQAIQNALAGNAEYNTEYRIVWPDGSIHWVGARGQVFRDERGQPLRMVGVNMDITERKQSEHALRESRRELQAANQTLEQRVAARTAEAEHRAGQLQRLAVELTQAEQRERQQLARILHDHLQQLLVGAKFNVGILRGQLTDQGQRQSLGQVDELLNESLKASRSLTAELSPPILHEGHLAQVLEWLARWTQDKHGLAVAVEADEQANPQAQEVRILLFQAVRELLLNIVKHAQVERASITLSQLGADQVQILVVDEGVGFDPAGGLAGQSQSGSGFGLFSIRERLELLGGWMKIESQPGQGTRVILVAPCHLLGNSAKVAAGSSTEQAAAAGRAARQAAPGMPHDERVIHVLLADDHAVVRDGLARLLQMQAGIEVVGQAADGQEAVKLALQLHPEVILMDVSMPQLSGVEATRCIMQELPNVRVIGLSMHVQEDVAAQMKAAGASAYLTKTSPPEAVIAAIRECVPQSAGRDDRPVAPCAPHGRKVIRVLLADDHEVLRNGLAHLLQIQPDIQVVGMAADGLQVVQMALQLTPDIIVMDVSMPYLSGVDVTRRLTQELPGIRVIGLSMHRQEDIASAMTGAGAVAYLTKSAPPEALVTAIRACAARAAPGRGS